MKNFLPAIFLLCASLMFAQTQKGQDQGAAQPSSTDNQTKVQGCLSGSAGNYTLTDSSGQTYQLSGDTSQLKEHIGHKVEITGSTSSASGMSGSTSATATNNAGSTAPNNSNTPSTGAKTDQSASNPSSSGMNPSSSGSAGSQTLNVSSVKHISESCDTGR